MEEIKILLKKIEELKNSNQKIIIEGEKDKRALDDLGIKNVFKIHRPHKSIPEMLEDLMKLLERKEEVFILTDLDKKGDEYCLIIKQELTKNGFKINDSIRTILKDLGLSHIEGLSTFIKKQLDQTNSID